MVRLLWAVAVGVLNQPTIRLWLLGSAGFDPSGPRTWRQARLVGDLAARFDAVAAWAQVVFGLNVAHGVGSRGHVS